VNTRQLSSGWGDHADKGAVHAGASPLSDTARAFETCTKKCSLSDRTLPRLSTSSSNCVPVTRNSGWIASAPDSIRFYCAVRRSRFRCRCRRFPLSSRAEDVEERRSLPLKTGMMLDVRCRPHAKRTALRASLFPASARSYIRGVTVATPIAPVDRSVPERSSRSTAIVRRVHLQSRTEARWRRHVTRVRRDRDGAQPQRGHQGHRAGTARSRSRPSLIRFFVKPRAKPGFAERTRARRHY
jgi:hypothetical protein